MLEGACGAFHCPVRPDCCCAPVTAPVADADRCHGDGFLRVLGGTCLLLAVSFAAVVIGKAAGIA